MATLENQSIASTYPLLLKIDSNGVDGTLRKVEDGDATDSALSISTDAIAIDATDKLHFDGGGDTYIRESSANVLDLFVGGSEVFQCSSGLITFNQDSEDRDFRIESNGQANMFFVDGGNDRIGIGTTGTNGILEIKGTTASQPVISVDGSSTNGFIMLADNYVTDESLMTLGITYSGGAAYLASRVKNDTAAIYNHAEGWESSQDVATAKGSAIVVDGLDGRISFWNGASTATTTPGTTKTLVEAMSIDHTAYVGIGLSNPSARLQVYETEGTDYAMKMSNTGGSGGDNNASRHGIYQQIGANDGSGTTYYIHATDGDGSTVGYLQNASGTFSAADSSDIRLKDDVVDTSINGLNLVNAMKVRDFKWKKSGEACIAGFVANELQDVFAPAVTGTADATYEHVVSAAVDAQYDTEGNVIEAAKPAVTRTEIKPMGVSRDRLVPVLIKAVQELSVKVTALENA